VPLFSVPPPPLDDTVPQFEWVKDVST
jgi:hypothetical protein